MKVEVAVLISQQISVDVKQHSTNFTSSSCPTSSFFFSPHLDYSAAVLLYLCVSTPRCTCPNGGGSALCICVQETATHAKSHPALSELPATSRLINEYQTNS